MDADVTDRAGTTAAEAGPDTERRTARAHRAHRRGRRPGRRRPPPTLAARWAALGHLGRSSLAAAGRRLVALQQARRQHPHGHRRRRRARGVRGRAARPRSRATRRTSCSSAPTTAPARATRVRTGRRAASARTPRSCCTSPADRQSATGVSHPARPDGRRSRPAAAGRQPHRAQFAQFNWAFQLGGAACTIRTVEKMTGHPRRPPPRGRLHRLQVHGGRRRRRRGLPPGAGRRPDAKLDLPAGRQNLRGEQALGYVRARQAIGNGSDTERMDRQQQFLGSLVKKVRSNGVLLNPARLYPVLDAATSSLTADPGWTRCEDLYELVRGVRDIPTDQVHFLTVPRQPYAPTRTGTNWSSRTRAGSSAAPRGPPVRSTPARTKPRNADGGRDVGATAKPDRPPDARRTLGDADLLRAGTRRRQRPRRIDCR